MSEALHITEQTFTNDITSEQVLHALRSEGAIWLKGFVSPDDQAAIVEEVLSHELTEVDRTNHRIREQFKDVDWKFEETPPLSKILGQRIVQLVQPAVRAWEVNHVRAQLYSPGEVGIEWHYDYKRDLRVVAVASFLGPALFQAKLDSGQVDWQLQPGDLTLMRGALLNGNIDDRPHHRVEAPLSGQRLSIAYREFTEIVPELEPRNVTS